MLVEPARSSWFSHWRRLAYFGSSDNSCSGWTNSPPLWTTSCKMKRHKSSTIKRSCCSWSGPLWSGRWSWKIRNPFQNYNMQTLTICNYASILAKSRCLPVRDLLCTSQTPSCARTRSIHSTWNLKVACGVDSVCASPFFSPSGGCSPPLSM